MKSYIAKTMNLLKSGTAPLFLTLALAIAIGSIPARAQDAWQINGEQSVARFTLGSGDRTAETGVARVSGNVIYGEASDPQVNFTIKSETADSPVISFQSNRSELRADGQIAVIGELKITTVERSVSLDPNEGYSGATYGEPVVRTSSREISLLLPAEPTKGQDGSLELVSRTQIAREYFPELVRALSAGNWPTSLVQDEHYALPSGAPGEDYAGAVRSGHTVETATNPVASGSGEGYHGFEPAVTPDGGSASIALELHLTPQPATEQTATGVASN